MLKEKATEIIEDLREELEGGIIETEEDFQIFIQESADNACMYISDCWEIAKEFQRLDYLDSGLWEGTKTVNGLIQRVAYAALEQEVYDIILSDYTDYPELKNFLSK